MNKPPRVVLRYQLDQPSNRYELDPLVQNQRRVMLAQQSPSQLLQLHLVGNVIPQFLPPLLLGYLLWDLSPISEIYRCIDEIIEIVNVIAQAKPVTMDSTSSIGHQIVEAIDGNRAARVLLDAGEERSSNKAVFSVPSDRDPVK